ncbi:MAG: undecaprenyl/decaprenyl-phosphate alpha-N-acetylglucosaminyl 1-phosphate transferase [Flavobacteriales bacterium]|nr:undecaprenyl/decaprenyl-phosphate alpha-N-acetylglucosaminyl 1-phosphate transferase [Flavobacteriales bacterium]
MKELVFGFGTAVLLVLVAMPSLIKVAKLKHLVDEPGDSRKLHRRSVPTVGGILIFAGTILGYSLWFPSSNASQLGMNYDTLSALQEFKYLVASMFILFFLGLKDDIIGVSPSKKLLVHISVGTILVLMADIRITDFWGLFNFHEIPDWASIIFSIFVYIVIVNAINLIDGVDGLAAGIGVVACGTFAYWFYNTGDLPLALLASSLGGSLVGFLVFNYNPAKIFMGDSGSLTIGVVMYVLAVKMIEFPVDQLPLHIKGVSKPVLAMAILSYPLIDTLRVFIIRTLQGKSPFSADKNHIHHRLLAFGFSHKQVTLILYSYTAFIVTFTFFMPRHSPNISMLLVFGVAILLSQLVFIIPLPKHLRSA